ncbi:Transmembrane 7 superfamily member 3 [Liparis tanakae]|uniref:Transmembrane 7 superfamily member 3 n=1 Tax=Liparis tanakae TaxID=230148 RepID=A0A4Z2GT73_9TELE|nr:Transmembrane 7 superfamily member 3 [Liparis tanakae]
MSRGGWCPLLLVLLLAREVQAQVENRVIFLPGTFQNVSVSRNETVQAVVSRITPDVAYVTLQFHTQHRNATLSYARMPGQGTSLTAVDSGLLSALQPSQASLSLFLSSPDEDTVAGTGVILPYTSTDPVPGACNTEFTLDIDPNVYILYNLYETTIRFAPANLGYERGEAPAACDQSTEADTRWRLLYDVYQYFLPENDLSERSLFSGIQDVADVQGMMKNGKRVGHLRTRALVRTCVMKVMTDNQKYIGLLTFHPPHPATPLSLQVMTLLSSDMSMAAFNSIPGQGVIYSVIVRDPLMNSSASYIPAHTYACSFASTLDGCQTLGKISTKVFFTVAGLAGLFGNIVTCGAVGAYAVILAINAYIYTSLSFITLNILKRFLNNNFSAVFTDMPFQAIDYSMITVWVVLGVGGIVLQLYRERTRPFFPPSPYLMWLQERERRKTNVLDPSHHFPPLSNRLLARARQLTKRMESAGEHTPLLL